MVGQFDTVFDDWIAFLATLGFAADAYLHPPAADASIAAAEAEIGFRLPDDLRALYLRADGQEDLLEIGYPVSGTIVTPLFGGYDFVPLSRALADYRSWTDVIDEWPSDADPNYFITLRAGDPPVAREYWRRGWFPFAIDGGGNSYAVDLSPPDGGTYGQVILIGSDEDERRVLAPSLTAFLMDALARRPSLDPEERWTTDKGAPVAFFEMEQD